VLPAQLRSNIVFLPMHWSTTGKLGELAGVRSEEEPCVLAALIRVSMIQKSGYLGTAEKVSN